MGGKRYIASTHLLVIVWKQGFSIFRTYTFGALGGVLVWFMATLSHSESRRLYSWWWDSHISPKNSKWLQQNLTGIVFLIASLYFSPLFGRLRCFSLWSLLCRFGWFWYRAFYACKGGYINFFLSWISSFWNWSRPFSCFYIDNLIMLSLCW